MRLLDDSASADEVQITCAGLHGQPGKTGIYFLRYFMCMFKIRFTVKFENRKFEGAIMAWKKPFAWSYSALTSFETCAKKHWHYSVEKDVREEPSEAMNFGSYAHKQFEYKMGKSKTPLPIDLQHHNKLLDKLLLMPGTQYTEQKLALNRKFEPTGWMDSDTWCRAITDWTCVNGEVGATFDWKFGKQKDDFDQINLVSTILFQYFPELQVIHGAYYWAKDKQVRQNTITRLDVPEIWNSVLPRVKLMEQAYEKTNYPAQPSGLCKNYCAVKSCPHNGG